MGVNPITSFWGNLFGIPDTVSNARRDAQGASSSIPAMPTTAEATSADKAKIRKKTKTILTSPLTGDEYYGASAPTLLGSGDATKKTVLG